MANNPLLPPPLICPGVTVSSSFLGKLGGKRSAAAPPPPFEYFSHEKQLPTRMSSPPHPQIRHCPIWGVLAFFESPAGLQLWNKVLGEHFGHGTSCFF